MIEVWVGNAGLPPRFSISASTVSQTSRSEAPGTMSFAPSSRTSRAMAPARRSVFRISDKGIAG
ncbi:MAG TPA: hypothetical protein PKU70_05370, partial [Vicinamibacteria bacterium]|nr:hypothetical protein [Vicinamibacteria bacterium]